MTKKQKYYVVLEGLIPINLEYEVLAESPEEAYKMIDSTFAATRPIKPPIYNIRAIKKKSLIVFDTLTRMKKFVKNYF